MKPKPIMPDTTMMDGTATYKKMQVEIPGIINIESDSGSHVNDFLSIVGVMVIFLVLRYVLKKYVK